MCNRLTIAQIEAIPFRLPLRSALRWGKASVMAEARHVLVKVTLSDGSVGSAEALPRPTIYGETPYSICYIIEHELKPRLIGEEIIFNQIWKRLSEVKNNQTAKGQVDIAIHSAYAQSRGNTLAEHLGCTQTRIRTSYILGIADDDEMLRDAQFVFDRGVRVLKVKVGRNWADDIRRIELLQTTFGTDLDIYTDANETMTLNNAASKLDQLREMGVLYCEEPLPVEFIQERATICSGKYLPIIGDDSCFSLRDLRRELALNTFDILNIKTARTGYTGSQKMAKLAQKSGKGLMIGSQAASKLGASHAALFAARGVDHPSELSFWLKMKEDIVATTIPIRDGYIELADIVKVKVDPDLLRDATLTSFRY